MKYISIFIIVILSTSVTSARKYRIIKRTTHKCVYEYFYLDSLKKDSICERIECEYFDRNGNIIKHIEYGQKSAIKTKRKDTDGREIITVSHYADYSKIGTCTYIAYDSLFRKKYSTTWKFWNNKPKELTDSTAYFYNNKELKYEVDFDFYISTNSCDTTFYPYSNKYIQIVKDSNGNVLQETNTETGVVTHYNYDKLSPKRLIEVIKIEKDRRPLITQYFYNTKGEVMEERIFRGEKIVTRLTYKYSYFRN